MINKINGKIKTLDDPIFNQGSSSTESTTVANTALMNEMEAALEEILEMKNNTSIDEVNYQALSLLETKLHAQLAIMKAGNVSAGGGDDPSGIGAEDPQYNVGVDIPVGLDWGVNTLENPEDCMSVYQNEKSNPYDGMGADAYQGTYELAKNWDPTKPVYFAFQGSEFTTDVTLESDGNDLILIERYKAEDGSDAMRYWRLVDGGKRSDIAVIISLQGLKQGVNVDARNARIAETLYIHGGEGNDVIRGSLTGKNYIVGNGGDDELWGGWRNDYLFGDFTDSSLKEGGKDTLYGLLGADQLYGGAAVDFIDTDADDIVDNTCENKMDTQMSDAEIETLTTNLTSSINSTDWSVVNHNGTLYLENKNDAGGSVDIDMAKLGISNLLMKQVGNDIVFYYQTADGKLGKFVMEEPRKKSNTASISGANGAKNALVTINVIGGTNNEMVDASLLDLTDTGIVLNINTHGGDDLVIGPKDNMSGYNLDHDSLNKSTLSESELNAIKNDLAIKEGTGLTGSVDNGVITVSVTNTVDAAGNTVPMSTAPYWLKAPLGYEKGFIGYENGCHYIVLVKPGVGDAPADTIVYKFDAAKFPDPSQIFFSQPVQTTSESGATVYEPGTPIILIPVGLNASDYSITGGYESGNDIVVIGKYSNNKDSAGKDLDREDELIEQTYLNQTK